MARAMTAAEKQKFRGYFPNLNVDQAVVTGEFSRVYNCLSRTLGVTNRWIWPGGTVQAFDALYQGAGFVRSGNGPIAAWGASFSQMTHGCTSGSGHGPRWESKCGADLRIQHGLNELVGASYGRVLAFYAPRKVSRRALEQLLVEIRKMPKRRSNLSSADFAALKKELAAIPTEVRHEFETRYSAWRSTWDAPHFSVSSDPSVLRFSKEFTEVAALGAQVLPLVVAKLAEPDEFFALQLYDALVGSESLRVDVAPEDEQIFEGEQGRAEKVVKRWLAK